MLHTSTYLQFELNAGEAVGLADTVNCELECLDGQIWVTEENGGEDIGLVSGQHHHLTRRGQTVIQSVGESGVAHCRLVLAEPPRGLVSLLHRWFPNTSDDKLNCHLVMGGGH